MKRIFNFSLLLILPALLLTSPGFSQEIKEFPDSGYRKNVIKWNVTPFLLFSKKNINLSYERVLSPYRSFSINAGYFELPKMNLLDTIRLDRVTKKGGFNISADYRFYFKNRNKKLAPDGLYISIFSSFYHTQFDMSVMAIDNPDIQGTLEFGAKFNVLNAGAALGYQFVIKERLTIDLIFIGPSLSLYNKDLKLAGDLTSEEYDEYLQVLYDVLVDLIPGFSELAQDGTLNVKGANMSFGFGFRYVLQIGFRF